MGRSSVALMVVVAIALLGVIGFRWLSTGSRASEADLETAVVGRGTLTAVVSASGSVEARRRAVLMFKTPGQVAEVYVETGDEVAAGDPLVRLNTTELDLQMAQARAALLAAEAQLSELKAGPSPEDVAVAEANLNSAQARLERLREGAGTDQLRALKAAASAAQANLDRVLSGPTQFELERAQRNVEQAEYQLDSAKAQAEDICGRVGISLQDALAQGRTPVDQPQCEQARLQVLIAESNLEGSRAALEELKSGADPATVANARTGALQAWAQLVQAQEGTSQAELAAAEAQVRQAQAQLDRLKAGPTQAELAAAEAQVEQARVGLKQAELALDNATLVAPMAGTVASVGVAEGELVSTARPAVVLIDTSEFRIMLAIDETDIGQIEVGQLATITLDAFPGERLTGQVIEVSVAGTVQQGIVTYGVTIRPEPTELALRPGMTAGVDIIVARKENVLLVPNRAIRTQEGKRVVLVLRGDKTVAVEVETGLQNEQFVEINSGLSEGDRVITSVVPTNNPLEGGFFGNSRR